MNFSAKLLIFTISIAVIAGTAHAEDAVPWSGKVTHVSRDAKKAVAEVSKKAKVENGSAVTAIAKSGESCEGKVERQQGRKITIAFGECKAFDEIKAGAVVEPSLMTAGEESPKTADTPKSKAADPATASKSVTDEKSTSQPEPAEESPAREPIISRSRPLRFALGFYYNTANELRFDSVTIADSDAGGAIYEVDRTFGVHADLRVSEPESWGVIVGLNVDGKRNFRSVAVRQTQGSTLNPTLPESASLISAEGSLLYRWDHFYLPFGVHYAAILVQGAPSEFQNMFGAGVQAGLGFALTSHFDTQLLLRVTGLVGKPDSTNTDLHTGSMGGVQLGINYVF